MLHWLILIPYYFFLALSASLLLIVLARLVRSRVSVNNLVTAGVLLAVAGVAVPLVTGWTRIDHFTAVGFVALAAVSFLLAAADTLLRSVLPLPLDTEIKGLAPR